MQCNTDKASLRKQMKSRRKSLEREEIESKSRTICAAFAALDEYAKAKTVCVYMDAFNEVQTSYIVDECKKHSKTVVIPVVEGANIYLSPLTDELREGAFGIQEPVSNEIFPKEAVDIFVVPGLAFDLKGGRVGFGKGYYDKLLGGTSAVKVGLCYGFQLTDVICRDNHDISMDYIITEGRVIHCAEE